MPAWPQGCGSSGAAELPQEDADDLLHLPYWLLEIEELAMIVLNEDDPNCADQRLWLIRRVEALKRASLGEAGSYDEMATATVDSPVPYRLDEVNPNGRSVTRSSRSCFSRAARSCPVRIPASCAG